MFFNLSFPWGCKFFFSPWRQSLLPEDGSLLPGGSPLLPGGGSLSPPLEGVGGGHSIDNSANNEITLLEKSLLLFVSFLSVVVWLRVLPLPPPKGAKELPS